MIILEYSIKCKRKAVFKEDKMTRGVTNRIAELLSEKEMTQKDLALKAQITESAISHYIKGDRVPRGVNLVKIARALETTTDDLLGQEDNYDKDSDLKIVKTLIARNASAMTHDEKMELFGILIRNE